MPLDNVLLILKGTSPSAELGETLQHATELLLNGVVAVAAYDAIGNRFERGARVFHRAARADKANDLVVVHRVAKRYDLVAINAVMLRELRDTRAFDTPGCMASIHALPEGAKVKS